MEWIVGFLVVAVVVLVLLVEKIKHDVSKVDRRIRAHEALYRHQCHAELPSISYLHPSDRTMNLTFGEWGKLWAAIDGKQDKPLLRRSTDVKHNRRKGDKK